MTPRSVEVKKLVDIFLAIYHKQLLKISKLSHFMIDKMYQFYQIVKCDQINNPVCSAHYPLLPSHL